MTVQGSTKACINCRNINRSVAKFCAFCGAPFKEEKWTATKTSIQLTTADIFPAAPPAPHQPETDSNDRIQIKKVLFTDKTGNVYEAWDRTLEKVVVFKEDREPSLGEDVLETFRNNFTYIGKKLAQVNHARMPALRDCFCQNHHFCVVMDYVEGRSLAELLKNEEGRGMKPKFSLKCVLAVSEVIEAMHSHASPLYHLNIKPSKVIITNDGKVCLVPWVPRPGKQEELIGSWGYAAPEQYKGDFDARSDVYGLGVLLHALLSGRDPARETPFHFLPLSILRPDLMGGIEATVRKAVDMKPENRFQTVKDFRRNLLSSAAKYLK